MVIPESLLFAPILFQPDRLLNWRIAREVDHELFAKRFYAEAKARGN
jgi:hypothetical protein